MPDRASAPSSRAGGVNSERSSAREGADVKGRTWPVSGVCEIETSRPQLSERAPGTLPALVARNMIASWCIAGSSLGGGGTNTPRMSIKDIVVRRNRCCCLRVRPKTLVPCSSAPESCTMAVLTQAERRPTRFAGYTLLLISRTLAATDAGFAPPKRCFSAMTGSRNLACGHAIRSM